MPKAKTKMVNLSALKTQLLQSTAKDLKYQDVLCNFTYANQPVQKIVIVRKETNVTADYYLKAAKNELKKEYDSGKLDKYCRKYLRNGKHYTSPKFKVCAITSAVILGIGGVGVGAYYLGKALNPGGGGNGNLVEVTFDADSTVEHPAYFNGNKDIHKLKFNVAKGTKFGDVKKMAKDLTRIDHIDETTKEEFVYDTVDSWSDTTSKVADEREINDGLEVKPNYVRDKVNVTLICGGNTHGIIDGSLTDDGTGATTRITFPIDKGSTLKYALSLGETEESLIKPSLVYDNGSGKLDYYKRNEIEYWLNDGNKDIYPPTTDKQGKEHDYENYIIEKDTIFVANFAELPGGSAVTYINVNFYASSGTDSKNANNIGKFVVDGANEDEPSGAFTVGTVSIYAPGDNTITFKDAVTAEQQQYGTPLGTYGSFALWVDAEGNDLDPNDDTTQYSRDFYAFAYYEPDFEHDTWDMIIANANLGKERIITTYCSKEEDLYTLERTVKVSDVEECRVRLIGVNVDYQHQHTKIYRESYDNLYTWCIDSPSALTFQFLESKEGKIKWGYNDQTYYKYTDPNCLVRQKLNEIYNKIQQYDPGLYKNINTTLKPQYMTRDSERRETMFNPFSTEYDENKKLTIEEKLFLIGGDSDFDYQGRTYGDGDFYYSTMLIEGKNDPIRLQDYIREHYDESYLYHNIAMSMPDDQHYHDYWARWALDTLPGDYTMTDSSKCLPAYIDDSESYFVRNTYLVNSSSSEKECYVLPAFAIGQGTV